MTRETHRKQRLAEDLQALELGILEESSAGSITSPEQQLELEEAAELLRIVDRVRDIAAADTAAHIGDSTIGVPGGQAINEPIVAGAGQLIGKFQIERQLGEGGYGVVFLARDTELARRVALKVPRPESLITAERQSRFLREGRAAALLSHPNIVPVFETGRIGHVCFIVSEFIDGTTLRAWLKSHPNGCNASTAASLVAKLADAVQHAHSKGVFHRDLKPANILLAKTGPETTLAELSDSARIADFGLARLAEEDTRVTATDAIVGTPAYLSPEQAAGSNDLAIGAASDIYSLGTILYELLTGSPPFVSDSILATLQMVRQQAPAGLRRQRSSIPADLEAICLKCLEKRPTERYATSRALASDLQAFLGGEPVTARPVTTFGHLIRWGRRFPALAATSSTLLLALVAGLTTATLLWRNANQHRAIAEARSTALAEESEIRKTALMLAERKSQQLTRSVQALFQVLAASPEIRGLEAEPLRRRIIQQAEQVYDDLHTDSPGDDPEMTLNRALAIFEVAKILDALGAVEQAIKKIDQSLEIAQPLAATNGANAVDQVRLQAALRNFLILKGLIESKLGQFENAEATLAAGLSSFDRLQHSTTEGDDSTSPEFMASKAHTLAQQALNQIKAKHVQRAIDLSRQCEAAWRACLNHNEIDSQSDNVRFLFTNSFLILGQVYDVANNLEKSESIYREAIPVAESIDQSRLPDSGPSRALVATLLHRFGVSLARQNRLAEARVAYGKSTSLLRKLVSELPDVVSFRESLCSVLYSLAFTENLSQNHGLARELLEESIIIETELVDVAPSRRGLWWDRIGDNYGLISMIVNDDPQADLEAQREALHRAVSAYEKSLQSRPDWQEPLVGRARAWIHLARSYVESGHKLTQAEKLLYQAIHSLQELVTTSTWQEVRDTLSSAHYEQAILLKTRGDLQAAVGQFRQANDVYGKPDFDSSLELAGVLIQLEQSELAEQELVALFQHLEMSEERRVLVEERCHEIASALPPALAEQFRQLVQQQLHETN